MIDLKSMTREERARFLESLGASAYREKQIFKWLSSGAKGFDEMSDLSLDFRKKLTEVCSWDTLCVLVEQQSDKDGTRKLLLQLPDGNTVEAVLMKYVYGNSVCLSTQVGCSMGCSFCASGIGGKVRNLKAWEILDQFLVCQEHAAEKVTHIVLMGTGEPFDNYAEVSAFLKLIHDPEGVNLSYRNITVSTCGIIPAIERFGEDFPQVNLAISLHASEQAEREKLMPIASVYQLPLLIEACRRHAEKTGRRVTFEYALIEGKNDDLKQARQLARLLKGILCHVNLIPLNPVEESMLSGSSKKSAEAFRKALETAGVPATVRRQLGEDVQAACGQLRRKILEI
ncbi:MAG: 23S rRNA (adenine(2503)-C(2))-methyltransferase RlmN [Clostridia bacterium]|nr:23S rRNA (adenine(2503)-C(2))-methyltransferase RlmN [Clostridia bacterium]